MSSPQHGMSRTARCRLATGGLIGCLALLGLSGCSTLGRSQQNQLIQRQEQLELQVQQLEQRLNRLPQVSEGHGGTGSPGGVVKSLTYRSGTSDDRLRIYWADGRVSDLPCTKEQNTLACG